MRSNTVFCCFVFCFFLVGLGQLCECGPVTNVRIKYLMLKLGDSFKLSHAVICFVVRRFFVRLEVVLKIINVSAFMLCLSNL